jgi:hypothetical protein
MVGNNAGGSNITANKALEIRFSPNHPPNFATLYGNFHASNQLMQ